MHAPSKRVHQFALIHRLPLPARSHYPLTAYHAARPGNAACKVQPKVPQCLLQVDVTSARRSGTAWHPDGGSLLAVPGTEHDICMFERLSWAVAFSLKGPHSDAVNLVSFSPNGLQQAHADNCISRPCQLWCCMQQALSAWFVHMQIEHKVERTSALLYVLV